MFHRFGLCDVITKGVQPKPSPIRMCRTWVQLKTHVLLNLFSDSESFHSRSFCQRLKIASFAHRGSGGFEIHDKCLGCLRFKQCGGGERLQEQFHQTMKEREREKELKSWKTPAHFWLGDTTSELLLRGRGRGEKMGDPGMTNHTHCINRFVFFLFFKI